jgi:hypothetical protein
VRPFQGSPSKYIMWVGVVTGKKLARTRKKGKT